MWIANCKPADDSIQALKSQLWKAWRFAKMCEVSNKSAKLVKTTWTAVSWWNTDSHILLTFTFYLNFRYLITTILKLNVLNLQNEQQSKRFKFDQTNQYSIVLQANTRRSIRLSVKVLTATLSEFTTPLNLKLIDYINKWYGPRISNS